MLRCVFSAALIAGLIGCAAADYKLLTDEKFPAKPKNYEVELFLGEIDRPHKTIAIVQSKSYDNKFEATKSRQLDEVKETAAKLGADAVQKVRMLENKAKGFVADNQTPFSSWKQGKYNLYFIRGEAIVYTDKK